MMIAILEAGFSTKYSRLQSELEVRQSRGVKDITIFLNADSVEDL